jgi:hypothetical protein
MEIEEKFMKVNIDTAGSFLRWFQVCVVRTDNEVFGRMIEDTMWDSTNIDIKIIVNGYEYTDLKDVFDRVDDHITKESQELAGMDVLLNAKFEALQQILGAQSLEELEMYK